MKIDNKKILLVKPTLTYDYRYFFGLTDELAKHFDLTCYMYNSSVNCIPSKNYPILINKYHYQQKGKFKNLINSLKFVSSTVKHIINNEYKLIIVYSQLFAFILPLLFPKQKFIYFIAVPSVKKNRLKRLTDDFFKKKFNCYFYKYILFYNKKIYNYYNIKKKYSYILGKEGWGFSEIIKQKHACKKDTRLRLVYLGTLNNRNIYQTVEGLNLFIDKYGKSIKYIIMGNGHNEEVELLNKAIRKNNLTDIVSYLGFTEEKTVKKYLETADMAVSYIPINDYYNDLPVTKTIEYILSGIPVIATKTNENLSIITEDNGVLINDDPKSFAEGLNKLINNLPNLNSYTIKFTCENYKFENAFKSNFLPIIKKVISD